MMKEYTNSITINYDEEQLLLFALRDYYDSLRERYTGRLNHFGKISHPKLQNSLLSIKQTIDSLRNKIDPINYPLEKSKEKKGGD